MNRTRIGKLAVAAIALCGLLAVVPDLAYSQGVVSSTKNPNQIAIQHWYNANRTTNLSVGTSAFGVAFDGASLWVANDGSNSVTKLRASDGIVLGTFAVGATPLAVAFDGANMWVTSSDDIKVIKTPASGGEE